jgi:chromate transporter
VVILLVTALLKTALKNKYVQTLLQGLKPCVVGIVLATGVYMVLSNCFGSISAFSVQPKSILITALLVIAMTGYKMLVKKKLSPIILIILSAILGAVIF